MIIEIEEFLSITDKVVIDMRTAQEYEAGHIIGAINFEILDYEERKKVSILYNEGLNKEAYLIAYEYALYKLPALFSIVKKNKYKNIVFYCARGGSRSSIVYEVFKNLKAINIYKIKNGYKSYRQFVNDFFDKTLLDYDSLTIYENVGVELPKFLLSSHKYLLVDLRKKLKAVDNPFILLNSKNEHFNNRLLNYFVFEKLYYSKVNRIVFVRPLVRNISEIFHQELSRLINSGVEVYLNNNMIEERVKFIKKNYFEADVNLDLIVDFFENKRKKMSNVLVDSIIDLLKNEEFNKGIKLILLNYSDPIMEYYTENNEIKKINNIKEIKKYLESWSE